MIEQQAENDCCVCCVAHVTGVNYLHAFGALSVEAPIVKKNPGYDGVRASQLVRALRRLGVECEDYEWNTPANPIEVDRGGIYSIRRSGKTGIMHCVVIEPVDEIEHRKSNWVVRDPARSQNATPKTWRDMKGDYDIGGRVHIPALDNQPSPKDE